MVGREGRRLVDAARAAGLDAPVPSCPDWDVRELVRHMGGVHHWAATHVRDRLTEDFDDELEDQVGGWPPDEQLLDWAAGKASALVEVFEAADPDFPYFNWFRGTTPLTMWTRRQAHETAIPPCSTCGGERWPPAGPEEPPRPSDSSHLARSHHPSGCQPARTVGIAPCRRRMMT